MWYSCVSDYNDPLDCGRLFSVDFIREELVERKAAYLAKRKGFSLTEAVASAADKEIPSEPETIKTLKEQQIKDHTHRLANIAMTSQSLGRLGRNIRSA